MRTDVASSGAVVDYAPLDARLEAVAHEYRAKRVLGLDDRWASRLFGLLLRLRGR